MTGTGFRKRAVEWISRYMVLLHIPLACMIVFAMEWMARHSFAAAWTFVLDHTKAFLYNAYLVYVLLTPVFLVRRRTFLRMVLSALLLLLGIINGIILLNRVSPFGYTDIAMVGDLLTMQNTNYFSARQGAMAVAGIAIYAVLMVLLFRREKPQHVKTPLFVRLILVIFCFVSIPWVTGFLQQRGALSAYFGNLAQGYADYGYLYGFGNSVFNLGMDTPRDYTAAHTKAILDDTDMGKTSLTTEEPVNVVLILLESFYDVGEASFIRTDKDPTPVFHELEQRFSSGHLTVPVVGAGTCDSEFEVLTGMSVQFFGPGEYPQKTVLKQTDVESVADIFAAEGYRSHVVHNNGANFYSRRNAFSMMGFDTFTSKEMLDITEYNPLGSWPTDDILTQATVDAMDSTPERDFVYTISVQTHGAYPSYRVYDDPQIAVTCVDKSEEVSCQWEYYINVLHDEDRWIGEYLAALDARGEPTLVIMFGDHLPTMGLRESEVATGDLYQTKYVTWNNFGMKKQDRDLTTYNLMPVFMDRLGIHGGTMVNYNQSRTARGVEPGSPAYMSDLEYLQYDLLYGKRYAYDGEDRYPASDIVMGIHDITIDEVYTYDGRVHIFGDNFTKWSKVSVNGENVSTTYESGQHLSVKAADLTGGETLTVRQMGSSATILRESEPVIYAGRPSLTEELTEESTEE